MVAISEGPISKLGSREWRKTRLPVIAAIQNPVVLYDGKEKDLMGVFENGKEAVRAIKQISIWPGRNAR